MKILHINASYKPAYIYGGPTMSVSMLCEQLVKSGIQVEVFTTTANGAGELPVKTNTPMIVDGVAVTYFRRITKDHTHLSPQLLITLQRRVKEFDIVHIHAWWNLVSVLTALIALKKKIPVILSPRGTLSAYSFTNRNSFQKNLIHFALGRKLLSKCFIHATSKHEKDAAEVLKFKDIDIIPNLLNLPVDLPVAHKKQIGIFRLIFLSRIEEKKGLDILLHALPHLNFPFMLTIAGSGDKAYVDKLKAQAHSSGLSDKISWLGFVSDKKFELLKNHDLLILPSYDENFANVVIEALSVGTPVLVSNKVGLADYLKKRQLGWISTLDAIEIAHSLNNIEQDRANLSRISSAAPQIIKKDFSTDALIQQYINLYYKAANERLS